MCSGELILAAEAATAAAAAARLRWRREAGWDPRSAVIKFKLKLITHKLDQYTDVLSPSLIAVNKYNLNNNTCAHANLLRLYAYAPPCTLRQSPKTTLVPLNSAMDCSTLRARVASHEGCRTSGCAGAAAA
jgi:hypothetical protein